MTQNIVYNTGKGKNMWDNELTTDMPYLKLKSDVWNMYLNIFEEYNNAITNSHSTFMHILFENIDIPYMVGL